MPVLALMHIPNPMRMITLHETNRAALLKLPLGG